MDGAGLAQAAEPLMDQFGDGVHQIGHGAAPHVPNQVEIGGVVQIAAVVALEEPGTFAVNGLDFAGGLNGGEVVILHDIVQAMPPRGHEAQMDGAGQLAGNMEAAAANDDHLAQPREQVDDFINLFLDAVFLR